LGATELVIDENIIDAYFRPSESRLIGVS